MKRVLYIGGFELPDKNAAAQRVLSIGKAYRLLGYDVLFCITQFGSVNAMGGTLMEEIEAGKEWLGD